MPPKISLYKNNVIVDFTLVILCIHRMIVLFLENLCSFCQEVVEPHFTVTSVIQPPQYYDHPGTVPHFTVTSVIQPPQYYDHPGTVPNYFHDSKV